MEGSHAYAVSVCGGSKGGFGPGRSSGAVYYGGAKARDVKVEGLAHAVGINVVEHLLGLLAVVIFCQIREDVV